VSVGEDTFFAVGVQTYSYVSHGWDERLCDDVHTYLGGGMVNVCTYIRTVRAHSVIHTDRNVRVAISFR